MTQSAIRGPFRRILCPIDFSKHSRTAVRYAAELARRSKGELTVLYANDPLLDAAAVAAAYDMKWLDAKTHGELRRFVTRAGVTGVPVTFIAAAGHAAPVIQRTAERIGADLIVMGSHGLTGTRKWFLGSSTERVLRGARVPVLIVPQRAAVPGAKALTAWPGRRSVVAVDPADYTAAEVRTARDVVIALGSTPLFLHVVPPIRFPSWLGTDGGFERERLAETRTALQKLTKAAGRKAECLSVFGDPADQIAESAAAGRVGLIVLTLKHGPGIIGVRRGSVTYRVAARGVAPVLAIPDRRQ